MSFKCRYCGEKFCSEHRLPENHDCEGLNGEPVEQEWFEEKFSEKKEKEPRTSLNNSNRTAPYRTHRKSLSKDILNSLKSNYTLMIILLTSFSMILQFQFSGYFDALVLDPSISELLERPWSLFTVALLHAGAIHLFVNMITFYFFGTPLERLIGGKKLLKFYLLAAFASSVGYTLFYHFLIFLHGEPITAGLAVGASGAVVAVVGAIARLYPDAEVLLYFIIPMKLKTAVYAFGGLETFNLLAKVAGIQLPVIGMFASSAHLTGLIIGLWYGKKLRDKYGKSRGIFDPLSV